MVQQARTEESRWLQDLQEKLCELERRLSALEEVEEDRKTAYEGFL